MSRLRELGLGARMAVAGGVSAWVRTALTALGVGLGVATLLVAASVPQVAAAREERQAARVPAYTSEGMPPASATTIVVGSVHTKYGGRSIYGQRLQPDGARPPLPPGVAEIPGPGEMVASPALARLLASPEGALLRERLDYPIVGTIADEGLVGPGELYFYLGADDLVVTDDPLSSRASRIAHFGRVAGSDSFDPVLSLIVAVVVVVLLLPIGLFVAAAIRFGSEARDRRLAGVRLLGADVGMARRIAAGEALTSAMLGLAAGTAAFVIVRSFVDRWELNGISVFPADLTPDPLSVLLLAAGVPTVAVLITLASLRRVVIEPLGVVRRAGDVRRRLWWRALLPVLGVALLVPLFGDLAAGEDVNSIQVGAGVGLILVGVAVLLPWLVQVTIARLRGGPVVWQLAVRRMQLDVSTPARAVMGVVVAVAGAVGLLTVYGSVADAYTAPSGADVSRADAVVSVQLGGWDDLRSFEESLQAVPGVGDTRSALTLWISADPFNDRGIRPYFRLIVSECATLRELATLDSCAEGDVFLVDAENAGMICGDGACGLSSEALAPGSQVRIEGSDIATEWSVPAHARAVPSRPSPDGTRVAGVLATPSAVPAEVLAAPGYGESYLRLERTDPDTVERLWTALWRSDLAGAIDPLSEVYEDDQFAALRGGLVAAATVTLLLIGVSLLVSVIEQLRERRRVLAGLVAVGTRRRTLAASVLWQAAVPIAFGLLLAVGAGIAVGTTVLKISSASVSYDWGAIAFVCGVAATVVLGITALSLPLLWRLMRADGLRTE